MICRLLFVIFTQRHAHQAHTSQAKRPKRLSLAACAWFGATLASCQPPLPGDFDTKYADWFLNPTEQKHSSLSAYSLSAARIDSLVVRARSVAPPPEGPHVATMRDEGGTQYALGVFAPAAFSRDSLYPLVIYLHGGVGTTSNTKGEHAYDMLAPLADSTMLFLASPSGNRTTPWWSPEGLGRILQAVRYMTWHYPIDPDRIILVGVSDGATGCYAAADAAPGPFAGFIAISGFGGMLPQIGIPLEPSNLMQRPIYNVNAGMDHLYPIEYVNRFLDWLSEQGVEVRRKDYPEEKHGFDYRDREMGALAALVRTWRRPHRSSVSWTVIANLPNIADNVLAWSKATGPADHASIRAYWRNDTLHVRSDGLSGADMSFESRTAAGVVVVSNDGQPVRVKPRAVSTSLFLDIAQHTCFPNAAVATTYRVKF